MKPALAILLCAPLAAGSAFCLPAGLRAAEPAKPAAAAVVPAPELPRGKIIAKIPCAGAPGQSYSLYLPSGYTADRAWPILYVLDPRGRGVLAAERFRPGAERYGYLLASSNNSASDTATDPNVAALRAMWSDSHARLRIDDRRVYAAGFSGTVRAAVALARAVPGSIAGIVGAGAGFPFGAPPRKGEPFLFFGTVGNQDFNYYEVSDLEPALAAAGIPYRVEIFDGTHQWPPQALAARALGWLELQAMKSGVRAKDSGIVDALWSETLSLAHNAEAAGDLFQAHRFYAGAAADFAGLHDTEEAAAKAAEIAANPAFQRDGKERAVRFRNDKEALAGAPAILASVGGTGEPATVAKIVTALKVRELRDKAEHAKDADERLSARRLLNTYEVQTSFYLPQMYSERKQYDRTAFVLSVAAEIDPDDPLIWYNRAAAYARKGDARRALADLNLAVAKGFKDGAALAADDSFAALRQDPGYRQLTTALEAHAGSPK
jgi:tetratricopeptide (TPR) repeat protein